MFIQRFMMLISCVLLAGSIHAQGLPDPQEERVKEIAEMLRKNPEIVDDLYESMVRYTMEKQQQGAIDDTQMNWLTDNPLHPWLGADKPVLTIINFTDYDCPFCKRLEPVLERIREEYQVQVVNVYLPMRQQRVDGLDTNSALYATQVWKTAPEKYLDVHQRLVNHPSNHSRASLEKIAKDTGTEAQLVVDKDVSDAVARNMMTFRQMGFRGTPTMLVGEEALPGFLPYERLKPVVERAIKQQRDGTQ